MPCSTKQTGSCMSYTGSSSAAEHLHLMSTYVFQTQTLCARMVHTLNHATQTSSSRAQTHTRRYTCGQHPPTCTRTPQYSTDTVRITVMQQHKATGMICAIMQLSQLKSGGLTSGCHHQQQNRPNRAPLAAGGTCTPTEGNSKQHC